MNLCPSAIATAAIFTALIVNDILNEDYTPITFHLLGGIFVVLGFMALCQTVGDFAGWFLLCIPIVFIILGFLYEWVMSDSKQTMSISDGPSSGPCFIPCPYCGYCNPCPCRKRRACSSKRPVFSNSQAPGQIQSIGKDLPKNTQTTTLGKTSC